MLGTVFWRRTWKSITVFLPRVSRGEKTLVGYSPCGRQELDTTEAIQHTQCSTCFKYINSFNHPHDSIKLVLLFLLLFILEIRKLRLQEEISSFSKVTQLASGRARIQIQTIYLLTLDSMLLGHSDPKSNQTKSAEHLEFIQYFAVTNKIQGSLAKLNVYTQK